MPTILRLKDIKKEEKQRNINQSAKYYNSRTWKYLRNAYIKQHPLCEMCLQNGIVTPAEHVHHKNEFMRGNTDRERWTLFTDETNLQALCKNCHIEIHKQLKTKRL